MASFSRDGRLLCGVNQENQVDASILRHEFRVNYGAVFSLVPRLRLEARKNARKSRERISNHIIFTALAHLSQLIGIRGQFCEYLACNLLKRLIRASEIVCSADLLNPG